MHEIPLSAPSARRGVLILGGLLCLLSLFLAVRLENMLLLFLAPGLVALPVLGVRLVSRPAAIVALFLLLSVNLDFFKLGDSGISLHIVFSSLFLYALVVRLLFERRFPFGTPVERLFLLFLVVTSISVALSVDPGRSLKNWFRDVEYLVLYSFLLGAVLSVRDRKLLVASILLSSIIPCLTALAGAFLGITEFSWLDTPIMGGGTIRRVSGTLGHPVSLSLYLAITATLTLSFILHGRWFRRTYLLPLFLLQLGVLYLTFGRTGWIAFFVSTVVLLFVTGHRRWLFMGVPVVLAGIMAALPTFVARWQGLFDANTANSFLWRIGLWAYSLTLIPQRPIFGSGPDTFTEYVSYGPTGGKASHQTWLGLTLETGLVGVTAFILLTVAVGVALKRRMRDPECRHDPVDQATVAIFAGILVASLAENPFKVPVIITLVWSLLALTLSHRVERGSIEGS